MNSNRDGKHEPADPENAVRLLEIELMRQRVDRQQLGSPYRGLRIASFLFLAAVILGAMLAFYYVFYSGGLEQFRDRNGPQENASATPAAPTP